MARFELTASRSQSAHSSQTELHPDMVGNLGLEPKTNTAYWTKRQDLNLYLYMLNCFT